MRHAAVFPARIAPLRVWGFFSTTQRTIPSAETCWASVLLLGKLPGRHDADRGRAALARVPQGCQQHAQHTFHAAVTLSFAQHQILLAPGLPLLTLQHPMLAFDGLFHLWGYISGT